MGSEDQEKKDIETFTLAEIRKHAWHRLKGICTVNKVCDGDPSRFCMGQRYGEAIGLGGVGKGLSFTANVAALDRLRLRTRLITEHQEPDLATTLFGRAVSLPVMTSSLSGVRASMGGVVDEIEFATGILQGALDAGTIGWIGNTCDHGQETVGIEAVRTVGAGIPIFKPQANERLVELIALAEDAGAIAVGIDIDGAGSTNWERLGKPVYRKSKRDISELADSTGLPFIVKGIMSVDDALDAVDAGANAVDISNHGGRAQGSTRGVADVVPSIVSAVRSTPGGNEITITAGGGVRTGFDVLKMLALGVDAVLIGRDIVRSVIGGGHVGVRKHFDYLRSELRRGMLLASCNTIADIDARVLDDHP
jgi:isopentenyl diphosphate isomerase/L-lactate dehydrogenase-like FMN-dependent dehydrogenase